LPLESKDLLLAFVVAVAFVLSYPIPKSCHSERSEEPPYFAFAVVLAFVVALAPRVGPGFSPDIKEPAQTGL
jgi:hypothetical protein